MILMGLVMIPWASVLYGTEPGARSSGNCPRKNKGAIEARKCAVLIFGRYEGRISRVSDNVPRF